MIHETMKEVKDSVREAEIIIDTSKMKSVEDYYFTVSKVSKALFWENTDSNDNFTPGDDSFLSIPLVSEKRKNTPTATVMGVYLTTPTSVEYAPREDQLHLTEYERAVADAVTSLLKCNKDNISKIDDEYSTLITSTQVYATLRGRTGSEVKPSKEALDNIDRIIARLSRFFLRISLINLDKKFCLKKGDGSLIDHVDIEGTFFDTKHIYVHFTNGKEINGWKFHEFPIPYQVDDVLKGVILYNIKYLRIRNEKGKLITDTEPRILVKQALLRRMDSIRYGSTNHKIKFETLYNMAGSETRDAKYELRKYVGQCLDYWKKMGVIQQWKKYPNDLEPTGIEITLPSQHE